MVLLLLFSIILSHILACRVEKEEFRWWNHQLDLDREEE